MAISNYWFSPTSESRQLQLSGRGLSTLPAAGRFGLYLLT